MNKTLSSLTLCTLFLGGCHRDGVEDFEVVRPRVAHYTSVMDRVTSEEEISTGSGRPSGTIYEITEERRKMEEVAIPGFFGSMPIYGFVQREIPNQRPALTTRTVICSNGYGKLAQQYCIRIGQ